MPHFIGSNVIVDRGYAATLSTNYPAVGGHPVGNMLTRRLSETFQGAGSAGRYVAVNLGTAPLFRVQCVWLIGCTLAGSYRIRIASSAGTFGAAVYDGTYTYAGVGPCCFILPDRYAGAFVNVFGPSAGTIEVSRLVLADLVDVSSTFRTDWGHSFVDPNVAQTSAPGGSYASTAQVARRQRAFTLQNVDDVAFLGGDDASAHGTSLSEIAASCGTTGEVILLPRVDAGDTAGANATNLVDFAIYGNFDRAPSFKLAGLANPPPAGTGETRLWQSGAMTLSSIADR